MRAVLFRDSELMVADVPHPALATNETLVRVVKAGICETDLQLVKGYMGFEGILGHEFVGVAEAGQFAGQRVVGEINCNCHACPRCDTGLGNHCANRTVVGIDRHDGAFAEYVAVPKANLHTVPDSVSDDQAVFVEPLAAAFQILEQVSIASSDHVLIVGDGRLGLMSAMALRLTGAQIDVVGKHSDKLGRFSRLGLKTSMLDSPQPRSPQVFKEESYDVVVDCTGSVTGLELAMQAVRPRGTIVMKTTIAGDHQLSLAPIVINEIRLVGSRCGPFSTALSAIAGGDVDLDGLITDRFSLDAGKAAFERATAKDSFKVVFEIE